MAATEAVAPISGLNQFFWAWEARIDRWRILNRIARTLATQRAQDVEELRQQASTVLAELHPLEELHAYPGPHLIAQVQERLKKGIGSTSNVLRNASEASCSPIPTGIVKRPGSSRMRVSRTFPISSRHRSGMNRVPSPTLAKFVIPYPPGFPIMVPGQVITPETIAFMRKLDVKQIRGYNAARGLELLKPEALDALR